MTHSITRPKSAWRFRRTFQRSLSQRGFSHSESIAGRRDHNEDRCYCNDQQCLYVVADGMGGHLGGALASQIAVETIPDEFIRRRGDKNLTADVLERAYRDAVCSASLEMTNVAQAFGQYDRMGCTMAAAFVMGTRLFYSNVGDCRVYHLGRRGLTQLSHDETCVQELLDAGVISDEEAKTHRWRHVVTNSINARGLRKLPRLESTRVVPGDRVLITSDGLVNEMADDEIEAVMRQANSPRQAVDELIRIASERGARDNVSCVVFGVADAGA